MLLLGQSVPQVSALVSWTSATVPAVPDMLIVPVLSGVGGAEPFAPPDASWTSQCPLAGMLPLSGVACQLPVPLEEWYWTE